MSEKNKSTVTILNPEETEEILKEAMKYLDPFLEKEEGGLLIGEFSTPSDGVVGVTVKKFIPVESDFSSWKLEDVDYKKLPMEAVGYYPNPEKVFKIVENLFPLNENTTDTVVGFVHNHMHYLPNPSSWDLLNVSKRTGYLMPIYSNKTKELKLWVVINDQKKETWESKKSQSLAQVELEAILLNN